MSWKWLLTILRTNPWAFYSFSLKSGQRLQLFDAESLVFTLQPPLQHIPLKHGFQNGSRRVVNIKDSKYTKLKY